MPLRSQIKKALTQSPGSVFVIRKNITSSNVTVAQQALSSAATGNILVEKVIFQTDATGLAGMTDFEIGVSGETYGPNLLVVEAASNLGASAIRIAPHGATFADTTTDDGMTVRAAVPFLLEAGDSLQFSGSVAAGTGAGICAVVVVCRRMAQSANIVAV